MSYIEIVVKTKDVLEVLKQNREKHINEYKDALRGYRTQCVEFFEKQLDLAKDGKDFNTSFSKSKPVSYVNEYDLAISMLTYHTGETIKLETHDARCFLEDKWDWSNSFKSGSMGFSGYSGSSGPSGMSGTSGYSGAAICYSDDEL